MSLVEQLDGRGAAIGFTAQHRVGGEQRREDDDIAQQEEPKPKRRHHSCRCRTTFRQRRLGGRLIQGNIDDATHARATCSRCSLSWAVMVATETSSSRSVFHACRKLTAISPKTPTMASHQMCQIIENPKITAKKATKNPRALCLGTSSAMSWGGVWAALGCCFAFQKASAPPTLGSKAKFHAGGGEEIDHSSVRPFQGSPVRSRRCSRVRILTMSCRMVSSMPKKMITAPPSATCMSGCQLKSAYCCMRRVAPMRPSTYSGMNAR